MNVIFVILTLIYLVCSFLFIVKKRAYFGAFIFFAIAVYTTSLIRSYEYTTHHEPMVAFFDKGVLVVLDSNRTVYTDSTYVQGKICLDEEVFKSMYGRRIYGTRVLNTQCQ